MIVRTKWLIIGHFVLTISLDLTKSSEVRKAGDRSLFVPINDNPNQSSSRGLWSKMFIPVKRGSGYGSTNGDFWRQMEKTYAMLDPFEEYDNPNKSSLRGLWMLYRNPVKRGSGYGRGFYDSGKRDFGGATFDEGFELSDWNYYNNQRTKRRKLRMLSLILWRPLLSHSSHSQPRVVFQSFL